MNFKRPNNKRFGKKKARAFAMRQWTRQTHRRDILIEHLKKEKNLN